MKAKSLLSVVALCAAVTASAQGFKMGVEAGYDNVHFGVKRTFDGVEVDEDKEGNPITKDFEEKAKTNLNGFHIGPTFNYTFGDGEGIGLHTGLLWLHAGGKYFLTDSKDPDFKGDYAFRTEEEYEKAQADFAKYHKDGDLKCKLVYDALIIPIRVSYTYAVSDDFKVFAFAGPKLEIGLGMKGKTVKKWTGEWKEYNEKTGKEEVKATRDEKTVTTKNYFNGMSKTKTTDGIVEEADKEYDDDARPYKRFNLGLGLGVGASYKNVSLSVSYDFGLLNRDKIGKFDEWEDDYAGAYKLRNSNLAVSVGVVF